ncbi:MAG TPA: hypothetical protein VFJ58_12800 [Armatimonadota bacterium]|nr:hypothetical protein [Armatimonadota bacterium]
MKQPPFISMGLALNRRGQALIMYLTAPPPIPDGPEHYGVVSGGQFTPITGPPGEVLLAADINDAGQVVGASSGAHAFVWAAGKTRLLPGLPGAEQTVAGSINDSGEIAGESKFGPLGSESRATLWSGGRVIALGPADRDSSASAVNNRGQVAGWVADKKGRRRAVLWDRAGRMRDLGTFGGDTSQAYSLNDSGVVVGYAETRGGVLRAFVWRDGKMAAIGPAGGSSAAIGVSRNGTVCGDSGDFGGVNGRTFIWHAGRTTMLLQPRGAPVSVVMRINDLDQAIGTVTFMNPTAVRAAIWSRGKMRIIQFRIPQRRMG